jgi:hypothetical protein
MTFKCSNLKNPPDKQQMIWLKLVTMNRNAKKNAMHTYAHSYAYKY